MLDQLTVLRLARVFLSIAQELPKGFTRRSATLAAKLAGVDMKPMKVAAFLDDMVATGLLEKGNRRGVIVWKPKQREDPV